MITVWRTAPSCQHHHGLPEMGTGHLGLCQLKEKPFSCWHPKCSEVPTLENQGLWLQGLTFPIQHQSNSGLLHPPESGGN